MLFKVEKIDRYFIETKFKKEFQELKDIDSDVLEERLKNIGIYNYEEIDKFETNLFIRLSLPFALIVWILLFIFLPVNYILTGKWGYNFKNKEFLVNWFRKLGF
jgi:hypothetical protein